MSSAIYPSAPPGPYLPVDIIQGIATVYLQKQSSAASTAALLDLNNDDDAM